MDTQADDKSSEKRFKEQITAATSRVRSRFAMFLGLIFSSLHSTAKAETIDKNRQVTDSLAAIVQQEFAWSHLATSCSILWVPTKLNRQQGGMFFQKTVRNSKTQGISS